MYLPLYQIGALVPHLFEATALVGIVASTPLIFRRYQPLGSVLSHFVTPNEPSVSLHGLSRTVFVAHGSDTALKVVPD